MSHFGVADCAESGAAELFQFGPMLRAVSGFGSTKSFLQKIQMPAFVVPISLVKQMSRSLRAMRQTAEAWMRQGISPRRLALTLALGFVIGCIPLVGIPTAVCAVVALSLRLNLPAIQAANYAAMPLQVLLIFPFVRLGGWMFASSSRHALTTSSVIHASPFKMLWTSGSLAGEAVAAWLVIAAPMVVVMTMALTALLRRVPALTAEAGD